MHPLRTLFRLYDLPRARAGARQVRRMCLEDRPAVAELLAARRLDGCLAWIALARFPVPAVVVVDGRSIVGAGFYDIRSPGVVGPVAGEGESERDALAGALAAMRRHGYHYAAEANVAGDVLGELAGVCGSALLQPAPGATVEERDLDDMPWADIFFDVQHAFDGREDVRPLPLPGIDIRVPEASERLLLVEWVSKEFGRGWASEIERAFAFSPISCVIAVSTNTSLAPEKRLLGFTGYNLFARGMGSTIAVHPRIADREERRALMFMLLYRMAEAVADAGYEYMVAAGISNRRSFLQTTHRCWTIPRSYPGPFADVIAYK